MECGQHPEELLSRVTDGAAASMVLLCSIISESGICSNVVFFLCFKVTVFMTNISLGLSYLLLFPQLLDMGEFAIS